MTCTTHHHACQCREDAVRKLVDSARRISRKLLECDGRWAKGHEDFCELAAAMGYGPLDEGER